MSYDAIATFFDQDTPKKTAAAQLDVAIKKRAIGQKSWLVGGSRIMEDVYGIPYTA